MYIDFSALLYFCYAATIIPILYNFCLLKPFDIVNHYEPISCMYLKLADLQINLNIHSSERK